MEILTHHLGQGLWLVLLLSMPAVLVAAGIGLVVGILQAVTQVQEQTLSAAPKIVLVFLLVIFGGGLMMTILSDYMRESMHIAFTEVPQSGNYILPPLSKEEHEKRMKAFFKGPVSRAGGKVKKAFDHPGGGQDDPQSKHALKLQQQGQPKPKPGIAEQMYFHDQKEKKQD